MPFLTHVTFKITGEASQLAMFDARVKALLAEQEVEGEIGEQHSAAALHYDLKVEGGVPFPPFAKAAVEFPDLEILAEWVNPAAGTSGSARLVRGMLAEQHVENVAGMADGGHAVAVNVNPDGFLALAAAVLRVGRDEYRGYALTGQQDALFRIVRDAASGETELCVTQGSAEWSHAWQVTPGREAQYRALEPPQPLDVDIYRELETLAREFAASWVWFRHGPPEEIAIEVERYQRLGYVICDANLRAAALHRIKGGMRADGTLRHSTLDPESAWVEEIIARCWAVGGA